MKTEIKAAECRETEVINRMEEFTDERITQSQKNNKDD